MCDATLAPRKTTVTYYCDEHADVKKDEFKIIDISEPAYCEY